MKQQSLTRNKHSFDNGKKETKRFFWKQEKQFNIILCCKKVFYLKLNFLELNQQLFV